MIVYKDRDWLYRANNSIRQACEVMTTSFWKEEKQLALWTEANAMVLDLTGVEAPAGFKLSQKSYKTISVGWYRISVYIERV